MKNNVLSQILSSKARAEIFRLLFDDTKKEYYFREIERLSSLSATPIKSELEKLLKLDLIIRRQDGNRTYYQANTVHPLYVEIRGLVGKTVGMEAILKDALSHSDEIEVAFIFGSIAENKERAHSDVDLFVIGEISLRNLVKILSPAQETIGREINPHIYSRKELKERLSKKNHFVTSVMETKKTLLRGNLDGIERVH